MILDPLFTWYSRQSARDQLVLRIGAVAVLLILCVAVLLPLQRSLSAAKARLAAQQADLAWMRSVAPTLAAAGPGNAAASHESLVVLIDRTARESGLAQALTGTQPSNGAMRVQLEKADFNLLLGWLSRLSTQQGVHVETASITGSDSPGVVSASVLLRAQ